MVEMKWRGSREGHLMMSVAIPSVSFHEGINYRWALSVLNQYMHFWLWWQRYSIDWFYMVPHKKQEILDLPYDEKY